MALMACWLSNTWSNTRWAAHSDVPLRCFKGRNSQTTTSGKEYFIQVGYLGKLHLTGVLVCCHGKVSPDKHKAAEHKYGSERSLKLLRSMNNYVASLRDAFEDFEEKGKIKIGLENEPVYKEDTQKRKQRSMKLSRNGGNSEDRFSREGKKFLPMIDHLLTAFQKRLEAYDVVSGKHSVSPHDQSLGNSFPEEAGSI